MESLALCPGEIRLWIGKIAGIPVPTIPRCRCFPVGICNHDIKRNLLRAEFGKDRLLVIVGGIGVIARVPVAEGPAWQQWSRAGQLRELAQGCLILVSIAEEVAVLIRARMRRTRCRPAFRAVPQSC